MRQKDRPSREKDQMSLGSALQSDDVQGMTGTVQKYVRLLRVLHGALPL